jgi:hypothetical protein
VVKLLGTHHSKEHAWTSFSKCFFTLPSGGGWSFECSSYCADESKILIFLQIQWWALEIFCGSCSCGLRKEYRGRTERDSAVGESVFREYDTTIKYVIGLKSEIPFFLHTGTASTRGTVVGTGARDSASVTITTAGRTGCLDSCSFNIKQLYFSI